MYTHTAVIGELACGHLPNRKQFLDDLQLLPRAKEATFVEALDFIERRKLFESGLGWVDIGLLASARLSDATVLTHDKRLKRFVG